MKGVYRRIWHIEEERGFGKYKGSNSRVWEET